MIKPDGGPAFPIPLHSEKCPCPCGNPGMTLRDYFAAKAMNGLQSQIIQARVENVEDLVRRSYEIADAMLKERGEEGVDA